MIGGAALPPAAGIAAALFRGLAARLKLQLGDWP
jgi:hypothetical protein